MSGTEVDVVTGEILPHPYDTSPQRDTFAVVGAAIGLADTICDTEAVPKAYRGRSDAIVAIFLQGYELGLGPMQSLRSIVMIQGTPTLKAETMRALVMRAGHDIDVEATDEACTVRVHRRGWAAERWSSFTFTRADAERANLVGDNWRKYPRAMLMARATSEACRAVFADVLGGVSHTPDEIGDTVPVPSSPPAAAEPPPAEPERFRGGRLDLPEPRHTSETIEGTLALAERLTSGPEPVRAAFKDWRKVKGYGWPPESDQVLAEMVAEVERIEAEEERDTYEPTPIRGDSAPVGSGLD